MFFSEEFIYLFIFHKKQFYPLTTDLTIDSNQQANRQIIWCFSLRFIFVLHKVANKFSFLCQARKYVMDSMGARYAEGVILDLEETWKESNPRTPLICFLSMGSDPTDSIIALGKRLKVETRYVSMGQGQEVHARKLLQQTMANVSQGCEVNSALASYDVAANQRQQLCHRAYNFFNFSFSYITSSLGY